MKTYYLIQFKYAYTKDGEYSFCSSLFKTMDEANDYIKLIHADEDENCKYWIIGPFFVKE